MRDITRRAPQVLLVIGLALALQEGAFAQIFPAPPNARALKEAPPTVSVSGQFFSEYRVPTGNATAPQAFDVTRLWLSPSVKFNDTWSALMTLGTVRGGAPAVTNAGSLNTQLNAVAQMAFVTATNLIPDNRTQFGMLLDPWNEFEIGFTGYQMFGLGPFFRQGYMPSFDMGLRTTGKVGDAFYYLGALNGEGFRAPESAAGLKNYEGILGYNNLGVPGLTVAGMGYQNNAAAGARTGLLGFVGYKVPGISVGTYGLSASDPGANGTLTSAFGSFGLDWLGLPRMDLLLRADRFDPNGAIAGDGRLETLAGIQAHVAKYLTLALTNQNTSPETGMPANAVVLTSGMFF